MDNLKNKSIKQFYYDTDAGNIVITAIIERETKFVEWYGHIVGYGNVKYLFGEYHKTKQTYRQIADYCAWEYFDTITEVIDEDVTTYMGGHENPEFHKELVNLHRKYHKQLQELRSK